MQTETDKRDMETKQGQLLSEMRTADRLGRSAGQMNNMGWSQERMEREAKAAMLAQKFKAQGETDRDEQTCEYCRYYSFKTHECRCIDSPFDGEEMELEDGCVEWWGE